MPKTAESHIVTRRIPFEFPDDIDPHWIPDSPQRAHLLNGFSLTMPFLEPYLIRTMREGMKQIEDPQVQADCAGFMSQEGQHYQLHQRFNSLLKKSYPELERIEDEMRDYYEKLGRQSLSRRMAYSAGFESMTLGGTHYIVDGRQRLFAGADTRVASFWIWHLVEEAEHKTCAFDAYQAVFGNYFARAYGVFHGTWGVLWPALRASVLMLKQDGLWSGVRAKLLFAREVGAFLRRVGPYMFRSCLPWHDPRSEEDSDWVKEWLRRYPAGVVPEAAPLVDVNDPQMPVPEMRFKTVVESA